MSMNSLPPSRSLYSFNMVEAIHSQRHDRKILILYGSETGNSQDVAEQLGRIAERLRFINTVCEMDQVEIVCF
jgi:sulfite reductase alpha subunit-like flavoprotein